MEGEELSIRDRRFIPVYILALLAGIFLPPTAAVLVLVHIVTYALLLLCSPSEGLFNLVTGSYIFVIILTCLSMVVR